MKLRLRSTATKETLKIEVPSNCTLPQIKQLIADRIGHASSSCSSHITVYLNRKHKLIDSPDVPLQSMGIASGDLLFYTVDSTDFVADTRTLGIETASFDCGDSVTLKAKEVDANVNETLGVDTTSSDIGVDCGESKEVGNNETLIDEDLEVDNTRGASPHFLKNVWKNGRGEVLSGYGLLLAAVQAVFVDAGFVRLDLETGEVCDLKIPDMDKLARPLRLKYTLGEIIQLKSVGYEVVKVRMYKQGRYIFVYGDMVGKKNGCYVLKLDVAIYGKSIELELRRREEGGGDSGGGEGLFLSEINDSEVFRFYKEVKDKLVLPLLIDLCDKAKLPLPSCLMSLPTELKLKIFELVGGADLAKLACQCSELRYLTSYNSLWKMKYMEEFGDVGGDDSTIWKKKFISSWKRASEWIRVIEVMRRFNRMPPLNRPSRIHRPPPFGTPFIIGGDYDVYHFGDAGPYWLPFGATSIRLPSFPYPSFQPSRRLSPYVARTRLLGRHTCPQDVLGRRSGRERKKTTKGGRSICKRIEDGRKP